MAGLANAEPGDIRTKSNFGSWRLVEKFTGLFFSREATWLVSALFCETPLPATCRARPASSFLIGCHRPNSPRRCGRNGGSSRNHFRSDFHCTSDFPTLGSPPRTDDHLLPYPKWTIPETSALASDVSVAATSLQVGSINSTGIGFRRGQI